MLFRRVLIQLKRNKSSVVGAKGVLDFQEIPSPKGLPFVGTTLSFIAQGSASQLHKYIDRRHKQLGPIFKEKLGTVSCVFVSDPNVIRDVFHQEGKYPFHIKPEAWVKYNELYGCSRGLFFMDGPKWWHYRRILNKALLKGDLKWIHDSCNVVSDYCIRDFNKNIENLKDVLYKWSLDTIVAILIGSDCYKRHREEVEDQVKKLSQIVQAIFQTTNKLYVIPISLASRINIPQWKRFVEAVGAALDNANSLVTTVNAFKAEDGLIFKLRNENMDLEDIKRIVVDLVLAAGDTTAVTFEWVLYCISKHVHIQRTLRENPEMAKFVIRETLRLYPIATFLTRILPADGVLGGYAVPKGSPVVMSMYTSGRDERYFKNPNCFQPERWDRNNPDYNMEMQKASLPFAMGLRSCVGKRLAEIQLEVMLLKIVNNFQVKLCNQREIDIVMKMVAHPSEELHLKFDKL